MAGLGAVLGRQGVAELADAAGVPRDRVLIAQTSGQPDPALLDPAEWPWRIAPTLPIAGVHLDLPARRIETWDAHPREDRAARLAAAHPGWTTVWHRDRFEAQLDAAGGAIALPPRDDAAIVAEIRDWLMRDLRPVDLATTTAAFEAAGNLVEVNPFALRDDVMAVPMETRAEQLARAIAARASR